MLQAKNDSELLKILAEIDISVPLRSEGRTKDHTESYMIANLLSALVIKGRFSYPLSLIHRERPDFLLLMDKSQIGIECTEAVSQNEANKTVLREKGSDLKAYFLSHHKPGESKKSSRELKKEIEANNAGLGWIGNSVEREWAEAMFYSIEKKVTTLLKDGFERFDKDWLLMYDNWHLPALELNNAAPFILNLITKRAVLESFERIFIITGKYICEISNSGILLHDINDLWN